MENITQIEKNVIGAIMIQNESYDEISEILNANIFSDQRHQIIYTNIVEMFIQKIAVDNVTLYDYSNKNNTLEASGGISYLSELMNDISSSAKIKQHSFVLYDKWVSREIERLSDEYGKRSSTEDPFKLISEMLIKLDALENNLTLEEDYNLSEHIPDIFEDIQQRRDSEDNLILKSKYIPSFNKHTDGLILGNLISIQGQDKAGKTTLAQALAIDFAINLNIPVAFFSLEMDKIELAWKAIGLETGIPYSKMRNPKGYCKETFFTDKDIKESAELAYRKFEDSQIYIIDKHLNELQIYSTFKRLKRQYGVVFGVIDYIGLIETSKNFYKRHEQINYISRFFKKMCRDLKVIACPLSQQNREGGIAEGKGLERDSDFAFEVKKPAEDDIQEVVIDGKNISISENDFLVTLKRSRHSQQKKHFLCHYIDNTFRERDLSFESEQDFKVIENNTGVNNGIN